MKIYIFMIVILSVAGIILISPYLSTDVVSIGGVGDNTNPNYEKLRKTIESFEKEKWNISAYKREVFNIKKYGEDGLIDSKQSEDLTNLLTGKYLYQLGDTIKNFCAKGTSISLLNELEKELETLKKGREKDLVSLSKLLQNYRKSLSVCANAKEYSEKEMYDEYKTIKFLHDIEQLEKEDYIGQNSFLKNKFDECKNTYLSGHKALAKRFDTSANLRTCNCETLFGKNEYYLDTCKKIQENR